LLEAAGACGLIAERLTEDCTPARPPEWWEALADSARTYRSALHCTVAHGFSAVQDWSQSAAPGRVDDLAQERTRLGLEHRRWICEVPGGQAYLAWLSAYVAAAEIDGARALASLDRCAAIMQEFVNVPGLGREPSVYGYLQSAADTLALCLSLPEHPLRDMTRFALLPSSLLTGYGS
jgi:hypothetical protein